MPLEDTKRAVSSQIGSDVKYGYKKSKF
jgi:hypothetical protein